MTVAILMIVFFVAFFAAPKCLQLILLIINIFVSDPIPYIDEVIMFAVILKS